MHWYPFPKRATYKEGKKGFCLASLAFILVVRVYVKDITLVYVSHKKDVKNEWNFFSYIPSSLCYIGVIKLWSFFFWCSTISFMLIRCELNKTYFFLYFTMTFFSISYMPYLGIYFRRRCSCVIWAVICIFSHFISTYFKVWCNCYV